MAKILIIEDDRFLASAYKLAFQGEQFDVETAYDGEEGLQKIDSFAPDCIVLDLVMPILDGYGVLERLNKSGKVASLPIIVASNLGQEDEIKRAMDLGAKAFITKSQTPITAVIEKVQSFLK